MKYQIALVRAAGAGAAKRSIRPSISKFITKISIAKATLQFIMQRLSSIS